jgi:carbon storage regulator
MLVLSRQRDETIMIGDDIEITVVDIRGDKVRLGINAPARVAVHRKEVYEAIRRENEQAARAVGNELPTLRRPAAGGVLPVTPVAPGGKLAPERLRAIRPAGAIPDTPGSAADSPGVHEGVYPVGLQAKRKHA